MLGEIILPRSRKYLILVVNHVGLCLDKTRYLYLCFFYPLIVEDYFIKQMSMIYKNMILIIRTFAYHMQLRVFCPQSMLEIEYSEYRGKLECF